jgi:hypothetical protein
VGVGVTGVGVGVTGVGVGVTGVGVGVTGVGVVVTGEGDGDGVEVVTPGVLAGVDVLVLVSAAAD